MSLSLRKRQHELASADAQRERLASLGYDFDSQLRGAGLPQLRAASVDLLQVNLGKLCNQVCRHCHVDAGPDRTELMEDDVLDACFALLEAGRIPQLDLTGGAPELHPRFEDIIRRASALGVRVMHRCNLTAVRLKAYAHLPEFLAEHSVEIVASLPYYLATQTDSQRGDGVFTASLDSLRRFNELGYGQGDPERRLVLVTNPTGAFLPAKQESLEKEWKAELERRHGIHFDALYTITNMPISRFLEWLADSGNLKGYMERLCTAFNPAAAEGVMCRSLISVGWDGTLYDCDFNQMLEMPLASKGARPSLLDTRPADLVEELSSRRIRTGAHCFGCTAGTGSSCGGATT